MWGLFKNGRQPAGHLAGGGRFLSPAQKEEKEYPVALCCKNDFTTKSTKDFTKNTENTASGLCGLRENNLCVDCGINYFTTKKNQAADSFAGGPRPRYSEGADCVLLSIRAVACTR